MTIAEKIAAIRIRMAAAAEAAGRRPEEISLCAATKMNGADAVRQAIAAGVDCCGENHAQEFWEKQELGAYAGAPVHFIGRLQTNKAAKLVGNVDLIQSVDRVALLECIARAAEQKGVRQDILLEVNVGGEESKGGFSPEEVAAAARSIGDFPAVRLRGLMTIPPQAETSAERRAFFAEMRRLFVDIRSKKIDNGLIDTLSMGMSGDYPEAIAEGSTMIRLGTAIFGERSPAKPK